MEDLVHEKEQLYEKLQLKIIQINSHFGVQKEAIQKQIDEVTKLLNHDRIEIQNYAKINIRWKVFIASVLITGIVFGETFTNQQAFLAIPKQSFITTLIAAIAISFGTYAMGALFVKVVRNTEYSELKKGVSGISIIAIVLFAYWSIGNFRQSAMSAVQASAEGRESLEIAPFTFLTINSLLFFGLIGVKLAIYPSRKVIENNKKYNDLKKKIKEKEAKIKRLNNDLNELEERKEKEKKKASQEYEELIDKIDQIVSKHYNALKEQQTIYNKKLAFGNCFYQEMCSISQEAIGLFAQQVGLYQGNLNELTVDIDTTAFKNSFSKFQPIYDNEIKSMFNPIKTKNHEKSHPFTFHKN
ncbi:MAG: hypothetical protein GKR88_15435 [Flavobacteriaceae bacterium]|nr:MAG: hypothetical protein GKR88_15435 [Flavobacteriaceae bacterium]